jgi:hypothetical protein
MGNIQGGEAWRSERENAQMHGFNSESERRSRRVADTNNGQNNGERTHRGEGRASASTSTPRREGIAVVLKSQELGQKKGPAIGLEPTWV